MDAADGLNGFGTIAWSVSDVGRRGSEVVQSSIIDASRLDSNAGRALSGRKELQGKPVLVMREGACGVWTDVWTETDPNSRLAKSGRARPTLPQAPAATGIICPSRCAAVQRRW